MSSITSNLAPSLARWRALPTRERGLLLLAAALLGAYLLWAVAVQPALRTLRSAPAQIDALDQQWQTMQRWAGEATELRNTPPVSAAQASAALKAASDRLGDKAKLSVQGERAVLSVNGVGTDALRDWLKEVRVGARARLVEATLTRASLGFNGTVVLTLGATT